MQKNIGVESKATPHSMNYDFLRLFAAFFIVMEAVSFSIAYEIPTSEEGYMAFKYMSIFVLLSKIGIPIFVMISGAFLLDPEKESGDKAFLKKYLGHLIFIYFAWSFFYALLEQKYFRGLLDVGIVDSWFLLDKDKLVEQLILGPYHLWYIHTLFWLYLMTPVLRTVIKYASKAKLNYFTLFCLLITIYVNLNDGIFHHSIGTQLLEKSNVFMPFSFMSYYLLGYVLRRTEPRNFLNIGFLIMSIAALYYGLLWYLKLNPIGGKANLTLLSYFSPVVYILSITLFLFFSRFKNLYVHQYQTEIVRDLSKYTAVLYMLHPFAIEVCKRANVILPALKWQTLILNTIIVFAIGLLMAVALGVPVGVLKKFFYKNKT